MEGHYPKRGWAAPSILILAVLLLAGCAEPFPKLTYAERYCYRTLADVDCHAAPLAGEESRRVGFYDEPVLVE
ncbi:MAG: hypothetical protein ACFCUT_04580 [Kiloniellaceae bacterium]